MQRLCAALLLGFILCVPFCHTKLATADTNIKNNNPVSASQLSVVDVPEVGSVRVWEPAVGSRVACAVGMAEAVPLVQQTVDVEALLVCDTVTLGSATTVVTLSVTGNPSQGSGIAVLPPVEASVEPVLAPWSSAAQPVATVVLSGTASSRNIVMVKLGVVSVAAFTISQIDRGSKTLAQLGFMLCWCNTLREECLLKTYNYIF